MSAPQRGAKGEPASGVPIAEVRPGGAAEEAGLLAGDRIVSVDGKPTPTPDDLKAVIAGRNPGDRIQIELLRDGVAMRLPAILRGRDPKGGWIPNSAERRAFYQNSLGGELSARRFGFSSVLQHDTVLAPRDCGGPIVDLDGRVVGFNIARAGRTESYALPVAVVRARLYELMSGSLAPSEAAGGAG